MRRGPEAAGGSESDSAVVSSDTGTLSKRQQAVVSETTQDLQASPDLVCTGIQASPQLPWWDQALTGQGGLVDTSHSLRPRAVIEQITFPQLPYYTARVLDEILSRHLAGVLRF